MNTVTPHLQYLSRWQWNLVSHSLVDEDVTHGNSYTALAQISFSIYIISWGALLHSLSLCKVEQCILTISINGKWNLPPCTDPSSKFANVLGINPNKTKTEKNPHMPEKQQPATRKWTT